MFPKLTHYKSPAELRERLHELGLELPVDDEVLTAGQGSPLSAPLQIGRRLVGNRFCIHPMEGWDAEPEGGPSPLTLRRWRHFGRSGAKLIWGGEAAAVRHEGRANPRQLLATPRHVAGLAALREASLTKHRQRFANVNDLVIGLQLTHSGRFARPTLAGPSPRIAYHHPLLDRRVGLAPLDPRVVWTDGELDDLVGDYVAAALAAAEAGFDFVDLKACHGYLVHELLGAFRRSGRYGGDYTGRTRFLRTLVAEVSRAVPELMIGVRLSIFDTVPFQRGTALGEPEPHDDLLPYDYGFGVDPLRPTEPCLDEPLRLAADLVQAGVVAINVSCGSPYYNPHLQRPASTPPSDGYPPPEDPLVGVVRQIQAARRVKQALPGAPLVGSGYSYLQEFLPHIAQAVVRAGWVDAVGLGRMVLSYPELPRDCLTSGRLTRRGICRTFSDCTTAPRAGLVSGCYPLDPFYKDLPDAKAIQRYKQARGGPHE